jgi:phenylacetate-CoA ligase
MTSLEQERVEQRRWTERLKRPFPYFDTLVEGEFLPLEHIRQKQAAALARMLQFASEHVPYYRDLFQQISIDAENATPFRVLEALPILSKLHLQDKHAALRAERLPQGERETIEVGTSGTTGIPARVRHSLQSARMFTLLKQREYRWFRFDPKGTFALIRFPGSLPKRDDGTELPLHETMTLSGWPRVEADFVTGPAIGFNIMNTPEDQIAWLRAHRADHLLSVSEDLEHLAFTAGEDRVAPTLKSVEAISDQMTPTMREHIESSFGCPIHQNYGLNEIGLVATRCDAGRYHVHSEHCIVEIIGPDGRSVAPGETGRLIITGLNNWVMPLMRYDADDLAIAVGGPCPCGRTLPSFGDVVGRYSRVAFLPEGTVIILEALRSAIRKQPSGMIRGLRQYQTHHRLDGSWEVRLVLREEMPERLAEYLGETWSRILGAPHPPFTVKRVDAIERPPGGKFQDFTSEFFPPRR